MKTSTTVAGVASTIVAVAMVTTGASVINAPVASAAPGDLITGDVPTLRELDDQVAFLIELPGSDQAKAAHMEGGMNAVVVARTLYNTGMYRAPRGSNEITGPETHDGNVHTAMLRSKSAGQPDLVARVVWKRIDGVWKLSNSSVCEGIRAVGLPMNCPA
ncbi:hypothetical protein NDR87_34790 [Nocardia sp. CDC159]|uniref:Low molecular weight antigen MTB12-like C-terminal domain-containing protein n=1 Tax=Nocardia pulmonis TaxID=2951408 RepID=A0A9X2J195_9NOCA|nr:MULTISPECIES: hypothetical protein [Nocardia]MCM6778659.1 hypothetical protein [Nocardia pulmonis]MCM6791548.1 hypothetical protein [Nocardia sp. CDC159]